MSSIVDSIASGATPSDISQEIKDALYGKAAERVDDYRKVAAANMFDVVNPYNSEESTDTESEE